MLNLLKRDLKLYKGYILMIFIIVSITLIGITTGTGDASFALTLNLGAGLIPLLVISIHEMEINQDTLQDLMTLPVSRSELIRFRYIEVLLLSVVMIFFVHLGAWLAKCCITNDFARFEVMGRIGFAMTAGALIVFFAFLMPFILRWDRKGLFITFAVIYLLVNRIIVWGQSFIKEQNEYSEAFSRFIIYMKDHPNQATFGFIVLFLALFYLSYLLSLKAFSKRDF